MYNTCILTQHPFFMNNTTHTTSISYQLKDLDKTAQLILDLMGESRILLLHGQLGAGKTTLTQQICKILGYQGEVQSPTYALVNEYPGDQMIYHMDLYRLKDLDEAWDIGIEDYLYSGNYCFIEWPEVISPLLEDLDHAVANISLAEDGRTLNLRH